MNNSDIKLIISVTGGLCDYAPPGAREYSYVTAFHRKVSYHEHIAQKCQG